MKTKRIAFALVMVFLMTSLFTACGSGQETADTAGTQAENTGVVEIELFSQKTETVDILDELIKQYETENPGVRIIQTQVPDSRTVLYSRMSSGDVPDIVNAFPNESDFRMQVESEYFMDVTGDPVLANVDPAFLEEIKVDGKDYSIPLTLNGWGIFYNQTQFDALGLEVPATWEDFEQLCADIQDAGMVPLATSFKEGWTTGHIGESLLLSIAGAEGAREFFSNPEIKADESDDFAELARRLDFFAANSQPDSTSTEYSNASAVFARGDALMMPQGIWALPMFEQAGMVDEIGMFPMPNSSGKGVIQYGVDFALSISASTEHPEEVKKFVAYLASSDAAQYMAENEKSPSTIQGVVSSTPATEGVTSMLFEEGRSELWYHFEWEPGVDSEWGSEISSYFVTQDKDQFASAINTIFGK